jgi:DNA polymerase-3 subunit alpha
MFLPINCKTHFSLLKGFSKPEKLARKCAEYGHKVCVLADIKTLSGAVDFHQACTNNDIKPILGYDNEDFLLIAKNKDGWLDLVKYSSGDKTIDDLKTVAENGNVIFVVSKHIPAYEKLWGNNYYSYNYEKDAVYYVTKDEADLHRIILCSGMKTTIPKVASKLQKEEEFENKEFFIKENWYLKKPTKPPAKNKLLFDAVSSCEHYEITGKPMLPEFDVPEGFDNNEYLKELCRTGWKEKLGKTKKVTDPKKKKEYLDRVKLELEVIFKAELSGYFLIVQDIINHVKNQGWIAGPGRGSAAGCLVSYLLGITEVDPIEFDLLFERFYNEGRNTEDHVSLPDVDMDVPAEHRDEVITYVKEKYGNDKVSQMVTFGKLQGRAAIKEVLRINDAVSFSEMNDITDSIPDEAKISDQLELMDKEDRSIIRWALEHESEKLKNWVYVNETDGDLDGPLAKFFEQAINIEGTNKSQGKHAAGVIISKHPLANVCPMVKDKEGNPIAALEMVPLEAMGHVKFDILGIDLLSKVMEICKGE